MISTNLKDIAILNIGGVDYGCIINKSEAVNLLQNADLTEEKEYHVRSTRE